MLVITNTYATEDGKNFPSKNRALIHAALQASGVYLEDYKEKEIISALDEHLFVVDKKERLIKLGEALGFPTLQDTGITE
ncbi:MAG: hypothetical protein IPK55_14905 [Streptococcus sp.]|nr:hypothetical protein [Streptococcus sp.]